MGTYGCLAPIRQYYYGTYGCQVSISAVITYSLDAGPSVCRVVCLTIPPLPAILPTMGRPLRYSYAGAYHHVALRCNNREFQFDEPELFQRLLAFLGDARRVHGFRLFDYCLMTNHFHIVIQVPTDDALSRAMHDVANRFSRWFNATRARCGHLWEGRFRSTVIEAESYLLEALLYVDLNPTSAGLISEPWAWPWSGCAHLACGEPNPLLDQDPLYLALGASPEQCQRAYRSHLAERIAAGQLRSIPELSEGLFVGTPAFIESLCDRFGGRLSLPRTRVAPLGQGVVALARAGRGGHRTSTARRR